MTEVNGSTYPATGEKKKRVRKWDNPNPVNKEESSTDGMDKIDGIGNADTTNYQSIDLDDNKTKFLKASSISEFGYDYDINEVEPIYRSIICLAITLDEIKKETGATVMVKGRYLTAEEKETTKDRPLYLHIKGSSQQIVNAAIAKIKSLVTKSFNTNTTTGDQTPDISKQQLFVQDKVFVGLDRALPGFNLTERILGPNGSYLHHIQITTGAKVSLRGGGCSFVETDTSMSESMEPLHLLIQHTTTFGIHQAKSLSSNLIQTIQREYVKYEKEQSLLPPTITAGTASMLASLQQFQNPTFQPFNHQFYNQNNLPPSSNFLPTNHSINPNFSVIAPSNNLMPSLIGNMPPINGDFHVHNYRFPHNIRMNAFQFMHSPDQNILPISSSINFPPIAPVTPAITNSYGTLTCGVTPIPLVAPPATQPENLLLVAPVAPPKLNQLIGSMNSNIVSAIDNIEPTMPDSSVFRLTSILSLPNIIPTIKKPDKTSILASSSIDKDKNNLDTNKLLPLDNTLPNGDIDERINNKEIPVTFSNGDNISTNKCSDNLSNSADNNIQSIEQKNNQINVPIIEQPLSNLALPPLEFFTNVPPPILPVEKKPIPAVQSYYTNYIPSPSVDFDKSKEIVEERKNEISKKEGKNKKRRFKEKKDDENDDDVKIRKKDDQNFINHPALQTKSDIENTVIKICSLSKDTMVSSKSSDKINNTFSSLTTVYSSLETDKSSKNENERLLMPPPSIVILPPITKIDKTEKKKLKGALSTVAALYGSDDED